MQSDSNAQTGFVQRLLPWVIAGVVLLVYLFTLSRGITYSGMPNLVKAVGWSWQPVYVAPLQWLVTYPVRWLPPGWEVVGLNLFAAVCSVLTLALLARSVAMLPHDRTRDQRALERSDYSTLSIKSAWLPPLLAVLVCGLQLTFWENAVVATGEALDLLLFAYVIRCLLEYRIDELESWLMRLALVYGLAITNNFAMIGFLPALLVSLVWIKGLSFLKLKLLLRMFLFSLAGLSLYLLLPVVQVISGEASQGFFEVLRANLGYQKHMLLSFPRYVVLLVGLTSLLPVLFMGLKWPASFADISAVGSALTNFMMHLLHGIFLVACLYVAFDPAFSPRKLGGIFGYRMLPFYYLGALSVGYFSGYFLLVFRTGAIKPWLRPSAFRKGLNISMLGLVWVVAVAAPVALFIKNLPQIQIVTSPHLITFGHAAAKTLKDAAPRGAVVLSDDPYRLYSVYAAFQKSGGLDNFILLDTTSLPNPGYQRHLHKMHPKLWPEFPADRPLDQAIDPVMLVQLLLALSREHDLYYLHPSFGYYFEQFYLKPENLVYRMMRYSTNAVTGPTLSAAEVESNATFWKQYRAAELEDMARDIELARQRKQPNATLSMSGAMYSRACNFLGVEIQKSGHLDKAGELFKLALELNPDNPSAFINQDYNRLLQTGQRENPEPSEGATKRLMPYGGNMDALLGINGPVDQPQFCLLMAEAFARGRNFRQAAQYLSRVIHYNPTNLSARLALVSMCNEVRLHDLALNSIAQIRSQFPVDSMDLPVMLELIQAEAWAHAGRNDLPKAENLLQAAQQNHPQRGEPYAALAEIYLASGQTNSAASVLEKQLQAQPEDTGALINYARLKMLGKDYLGAMPYLDRALKIQGQNVFALLNRAIANLQSGQLDAAQRDYEALQKLLPKPQHAVSYGLQEVHFKKRNRQLAIKYCNEFLKLAPPGTPEIKLVQDRLKSLKAGFF